MTKQEKEKQRREQRKEDRILGNKPKSRTLKKKKHPHGCNYNRELSDNDAKGMIAAAIAGTPPIKRKKVQAWHR